MPSKNSIAFDSAVRVMIAFFQSGVLPKNLPTLLARPLQFIVFTLATLTSKSSSTALAISKEDATAPARVVAKFAKDNKKIELKSGVVEGTYYDKDGIGVIATIPSKEELLSKFLGSLQSPITNFARVINQVAEQKAGAEA